MIENAQVGVKFAYSTAVGKIMSKVKNLKCNTLEPLSMILRRFVCVLVCVPCVLLCTNAMEWITYRVQQTDSSCHSEASEENR